MHVIRFAFGGMVLAVSIVAGAPDATGQTVPTEIQQPGTQPLQVSNLGGAGQCDNCHGGYDAQVEPARLWRGSMMAQAGRDPLFWAAVAVAEQDFPGAGDLCIRCHAPRGWLEGRSTPTDGSALTAGDADGVECAICHKMTDPDGTGLAGVQIPPFVANSAGPSPAGYYGSGMLVMWPGSERLGPYADAWAAPHAFLPSAFHRSSEMCGTCHDVSNPAVGDLAPRHGAQAPLPPGAFSGVPGAPVTTKAAFLNPPYAYGVVERTFSEHAASLFPTLPVSGFPNLPADLRRGALQEAYQASLLAGQGGRYADGTERFFTCQTCHLIPGVGKGCDRNNAPMRGDLPLHHLAGGNYWVPQAIQYLDAQSQLVLGGGLTALQNAALSEGALRARGRLTLAAALEVQGDVVRVVNLTGHKLISGYPEGRRMWLNVKWRGASGAVIREDGAYGPIAVTLQGVPLSVPTILAPEDPNTRIYQAKFGMSQEWGSRLLGFGYSAGFPLAYDRVSGAVEMTLGQLALSPPGTTHETFHFALNDVLLSDNRIPPYGMTRAAASARNILPVPPEQYGDPGPAGSYHYWDEVLLDRPPGAATATIYLLYQPTSWEYVQFLRLANTGLSANLAAAGQDLLEAWLATGMAAPEVMASATWSAACSVPAAWGNYGVGAAGSLGVPSLVADSRPVLGNSFDIEIANAAGQTTPAWLGIGTAPAAIPLPLGGTILVTLDAWLEILLPATGFELGVALPADPALCGFALFGQALEIDPGVPAGFSLSRGLQLVLGSP